jgi:hypothetical protein
MWEWNLAVAFWQAVLAYIVAYLVTRNMFIARYLRVLKVRVV